MKFFDGTKKRRTALLLVLMATLIGLMVVMYMTTADTDGSITVTSGTASVKDPVEPQLETKEVVSGLSRPWDIVFLPSGTMVFNQRSGSISTFKDGQTNTIAQINDIYAVGEGGLTGLALDADFANNRFVYTCFNAQSAATIDVRVVRWTLSKAEDSLTDRTDIVTGIPSNKSGRHSGCRVRVAKDGSLWIATGDAAIASNPQDPQSLGGKILHVSSNGQPIEGNLAPPYDGRIFSYGHRNVQGLALFDRPINGVYGYSVEHGSDRDDEVNILKSGNFGWAPRVTYEEDGIPMTDLVRYPDAISAVWSSGKPTIAPSGATLLSGKQWGIYNGALAVAVLKDKHVHIFKFDDANKLVFEREVLGDFGRIRSAAQGPDGNLYISTDNASNDKIIKITPKS